MDQKRSSTGRSGQRWGLALAVTLVAALAAGCGGDDERAAGPTSSAPPSGVPERAVDRKMVEVADAYVGRVADTEAFIAVTFDDGIVRAYVCDGEGTEDAISQWFQSSWDGTGAVTLTGGPFRTDARARRRRHRRPPRNRRR